MVYYGIFSVMKWQSIAFLGGDIAIFVGKLEIGAVGSGRCWRLVVTRDNTTRNTTGINKQPLELLQLLLVVLLLLLLLLLLLATVWY
jgi:hypothetical protein